jgi:hypothetical protein
LFNPTVCKTDGQSFITEGGKAIEGEALVDVIVIGRVTYFVNRAGEDDCPVM